ncbi:MAG: GDSL-type esterase/lipase family protein [Planctomycetota bacterium]|jgi:lysophospholipase L1-like esterase
MKKDICTILVIVVSGLFFCGCASTEKTVNNDRISSGLWPVRILCIGDSITAGSGGKAHGGFRGPLGVLLTKAEVDFTLRHDGNGGRRLERMLKDKRAIAQKVLTAYPNPDVILLLVGINDLIENRNTIEATLERLGLFIDELVDLAPKAKIIVGNLVPNAADNPLPIYDPAKTYVNSEDKVVVFNRKLPGFIKSKKSQGINIDCVDFHSLMTREDLADGIHPNKNGYSKMAVVWSEAIISAMKP